MTTPGRSALTQCVLTVALAVLARGVEIPADKLIHYAPLPSVATSASNPLTAEKIELGRMLFFEARLSRSQTVSCNTCHNLARYGADVEPTSTGIKGQRGDRNAPSVYNAAANFVQFWDGRAPDVEAQASSPMLNPIEMGMLSEKQVTAVLNSIPEYVDRFQRAFPAGNGPVSLSNASKAIGAFERKLLTPGRWDAFLRGDTAALTDEEKAGFLKFYDLGCADCHNGPLLGGNSYKKLGVKKRWPGLKDPGRARISKDPSDKFVFKVASLRNVAKTGPYFHNGSAATLDEAVRQMSEYQLGRVLNPSDVTAIVTWLNALTGPLPDAYIAAPRLPPSTDQTPKPIID
jgi:cytochrome c peroxidase